MNKQHIIQHLSNIWNLSNIRPLQSHTENYVAVAHSAQYSTDVILKILIADTHEVEALKIFDGNECVKLLNYDPETSGLLLEYIQPGVTLKTLFPEEDDQAINIAAALIKKIHKKDITTYSKTFKTIDQWLELLHTFQSDLIPKTLLQKAQKLSKKLLSLKPPYYLIHGDLHHENILQKNDEWIAIDPQGVIGPLEYEVGRFIINPIPDLLQQHNVQEIIKNRIKKFSNIFNLKAQQVIGWTFVQAILSACWAEQSDNTKLVDYFVKFAQTIKTL